MSSIFFILYYSFITFVSRSHPSFHIYTGEKRDGDGILGPLTYKMEVIIYLPCIPRRVVVGNKLQNEIMK